MRVAEAEAIVNVMQLEDLMDLIVETFEPDDIRRILADGGTMSDWQLISDYLEGDD